MRKIVFFTKGGMDTASSLLRVHRVAHLLQAQGFHAESHALLLLPFKRHPLRRLSQLWKYNQVLLRMRNTDVLYLHKTIFLTEFIFLILIYKRLFKRRFYFDFDDAIFLHTPRNTRWLTSHACGVLVGSHSLSEYAKKYNKNVILLPTSIDINLFYPSKNISNKKQYCIGWEGSSAHYNNLVSFLPVLVELNKQSVEFEMVCVVMGDVSKIQKLFVNFPQVKIMKQVPLNELPKIIRTFTVGVMPLLSNEWSKGKCSMKLLDYMSCGVPAIGSDVGENSYLIQNGVNGYLAASTEEWVKNITLLFNDPKLCSDISRNARSTVETYYSLEKNVEALKKFVGISENNNTQT